MSNDREEGRLAKRDVHAIGDAVDAPEKREAAEPFVSNEVTELREQLKQSEEKYQKMCEEARREKESLNAKVGYMESLLAHSMLLNEEKRQPTSAEIKELQEILENEICSVLLKKTKEEKWLEWSEEEKEKTKKKDEEEENRGDVTDNGDGDRADNQSGDEGINVARHRPYRPGQRVVNNKDIEDERMASRRARMDLLNNRYLNHSDPDLAMADEERERREMAERDREREREVEREDEQRRQIQEARQRMQQLRAEAAEDDHVEEEEAEVDSLMSAEEQRHLVRHVRSVLDNRPLEGMSDDDVRLVQQLRLALETDGNISRDAIMRYRVEETNRLNRERNNPDNNSPYRLSSVVMSRMSLAEIGARVDAIRSQSRGTLYPLEIFYQLHLADILWPLVGRHITMGDNVYTHDEINRVLGDDSPMVPPGADRLDFHQLMRKRALTAASLTGRSYAANRENAGFQYQPPRLPDLGVYQTFGDPTVLVAVIDGDLEPIREAIRRMPLTMPDVMRLDNRSVNTLGSHLRHFRDWLDERARQAGFELRPDIYAHDEVPPEPTGARPEPNPDPNLDPDADPEF